MERFQFKTNINCDGCVAKVTPHFNVAEGIKDWKVDTNNPNKILSIEAEGLSEDEVKEIVQKAGFKIDTV